MAVSGESNPWFGRNILDANAVGGRPVAGLLSTLFFTAAGTIDNLRFVRLVALVGIAALALLLHWALVRSGIRSAVAALMTVLVCCMPAFQVFASWAVLFVAPFAALLGASASTLTVSAIDSARQLMTDRLVAAVAALVTALLIYQPAAMFFWVFLAVALVGAVREPVRGVRIVKAHAGVAVVALPLALFIGKLTAHLAHNTSPNATRSTLTRDPIGKAHWFFAHPLYRSLSLFELTPSPWLAAFVVSASAGGMTLWLLLRGSRPYFYLGTAAALVPLSFLPNLVVEENNSLTFRTGIALTSLITLYTCLGVLGIGLVLRDRLRPQLSGRALATVERAAFGVSTALVAIIAFAASRNVTTLVVDPQSTELRILRRDVAALPAGVARVGFVQIGWNQGMTNWYSDELGLASSARPWTPEPAVYLILREEGRLGPSTSRPVVETLPAEVTKVPNGEPVVDLRELQRLR
jgi:hypothetical protein